MKERGLFRLAISVLAGDHLRSPVTESKAKKEMRLYEAHFASPTTAKFYDQTIDRAMAHKMTPSAMALSHIQTLDATSLYELRHNQAEWDSQPDEVKAVFEIALAIAKADLKRKGVRKHILAVGEGEGDMILQEDAVYAARDWNDFGASNPDTTVVTELYKLLGLEDKIEDIPSIPRFNRFVHNDIFRFHVLPDSGVKLLLSFSGSSAGEFEDNDKKVPFYPAHIGMTVKAKRTLVK